MRQVGTALRGLRASVNACSAGLLAILLHLLLTTAHVSAEAEAVAIGGPNGQPLGFLQICTAEGLRSIPLSGEAGEGSPADHGAMERCPVCGAPAVNAALDDDGAVTTTSVPWLSFETTVSRPSGDDIRLPSLLRYTLFCRGPPRPATIV